MAMVHAMGQAGRLAAQAGDRPDVPFHFRNHAA